MRVFKFTYNLESEFDIQKLPRQNHACFFAINNSEANKIVTYFKIFTNIIHTIYLLDGVKMDVEINVYKRGCQNLIKESSNIWIKKF